MAQDESSADDAAIAVEADPFRDEFTGYLTSTGRVKPKLARSLYDMGLSSYDLLKSGDLKYFMSFTGVGDRTAQALYDLGRIRERQEIEEARARYRTYMKERGIRSNVIDILESEGIDSPDKILEKGPEGLVTIRGIGKKTADMLISACAEAVTEAPQADGGQAEAPAEEESAPGIIDRIIGFFKGLFSGRKDEAQPEAPTSPQEEERTGSVPVPEPVEDKEEGPEPEEPSEPGIPDPVEDPIHEEVLAVDASAESGEPEPEKDLAEPVEEEQAEKPAPEATSPQEDVEQPTEAPPEKEEPKEGLMDRIKRFFSKKPSGPEAGSDSGTLKEEDHAEAASEKEEKEGPEGISPENKGDVPEEDKAEEEVSVQGPVVEAPEPPPEINSMEDIPGVGPEIIELLKGAGYRNLDELKEAVPEDLVLIKGIDMETAKMICGALHPEP
ncbi:MAG: helix-hairpin-helix domain-containing protein [Candidatus Thermoplasmatota archaeon]|nr:helix-hairpin-helix domain-containing protein [Candidatus Thermoplasmatota archaeon]